MKEAPSRGDGPAIEVKSEVNYSSIFGSCPNRRVAGESHLAEDLHQHMIVKSQNFRGEFSIPEDLEDFIGYDSQVDKT